jgi:hypothetical protein
LWAAVLKWDYFRLVPANLEFVPLAPGTIGYLAKNGLAGLPIDFNGNFAIDEMA